MRQLFLVVAMLVAERSGAAIQPTPEANMDIYEAGGNGNGAGNAPVELTLLFEPGDVVRFPSINGSTDCHAAGSNCDATGPEGNLGADVTVGTVNLLSGIQYRGYFSLPLMGVFLGASLPAVAPVALDFRNAEDFERLDPLLGQVFWIGDGLTGNGVGAVQDFGIPSGATRLALGFIDAVHGDNNGGLSVQVEIAPEPAGAAIAFAAIATLITLRRRKEKF